MALQLLKGFRKQFMIMAYLFAAAISFLMCNFYFWYQHNKAHLLLRISLSFCFVHEYKTVDLRKYIFKWRVAIVCYQNKAFFFNHMYLCNLEPSTLYFFKTKDSLSTRYLITVLHAF